MTKNVFSCILSWSPFVVWGSFGIGARHSKLVLNLNLGIVRTLYICWCWETVSWCSIIWFAAGLFFCILSLSQDNSMHSVHRTIFLTTWEEFFAFHCTCNDIANDWVLFWQVGSKVHFLPKITIKNCYEKGMGKFIKYLPFVLLFERQSWESKIRSDRVSFHKVYHPI